MQSSETIRSTRTWRQSDDNRILTPGDEYNQSHNEAKLTRQMRAIKQHFGLGSLLGSIAILVAIGAPFVRQSEINGSSTMAIDRLTVAQRENKEEQARNLADAVTRIEAGIKTAVDLAVQNREEMRSMRTSTDGAFVELRQDTKGLWKWATSIDGRVGVLEAEIRKKEK